MRDTSDKIKMDETRKKEMREMLMSSPAITTEIPKSGAKKKAVTVILIAAVISALGISAYAAFSGGLEALSFGKSSWGSSIEEDIENSLPPRELISAQGYPDSPEYQATAEWIKFADNYDLDGNIYREADENIKLTGTDPFKEKYGAYFVYSQEMADKIDEITAKYGLELHTGRNDGDEKKLEEKVGDIFTDAITGTAYFYDDGTFQMNALYNNSLNCYVRRCVRGYFDDVYIKVGDTTGYEEYTYMTKSGVEVIISTGKDGSGNDRTIITANLEKSFVSINIGPADYNGKLNTYTKEDIENLADQFYFDKL